MTAPNRRDIIRLTPSQMQRALVISREQTSELRDQLARCVEALQACSSGDIYAVDFARKVLRELGEQPELSR
jgi:hypothetical protein